MDIPARVVVGAFARPGLAAHAWIEVYDGGWFSVDAALGNTQAANRDSWFDFVANDRVVFSYDCDLDIGNLRPPRGRTGVDIACAEEVVNWGGNLLKGGVPYLQPGYPLIDEVLIKPLTIPVWDISEQKGALRYG